MLNLMDNISNTGWDLQNFLCRCFTGHFQLFVCVSVRVHMSVHSNFLDQPCRGVTLSLQNTATLPVFLFPYLCPAPPYYFRQRPSALYPFYTSSRLSFLESLYSTAHRRPHWPLEDWYRHRMSIVFTPYYIVLPIFFFYIFFILFPVMGAAEISTPL